MTVKEFYDYAVKNGCKNAEIYLNYECNDDWYSFEGQLKKEYLTCFCLSDKPKKAVCISF